MGKHSARLWIVMVTILIFSWVKPAQAGLNVFFSPKNGFLRVEGSIEIVPLGSRFSLRLFPNAQLTVLWSDGLINYNIDRGSLGTIISVHLNDSNEPQELSIAYEGFLDDFREIATLGRDQVWYPEFSIPAKAGTINLQLGNDWHVIEPQLEITATDEDNTYTWTPEPGTYPTIILAHDSVTEFPSTEEISVSELVSEESNSEELSFEDPSFEEEAPAEIHVSEQSGIITRNDSVYPELSYRLSEFDNALSAREQDIIEKLLTKSLISEGLGSYLASLPERYGAIKSEIIEMKQEGNRIILNTTIYADQTEVFTTEMAWEKSDNHWQITEYTMTPYMPAAPSELVQSLLDFVENIRLAVLAESRELLASYLTMNANEKQQSIEFLLSLNPNVEWRMYTTMPERLGITIIVPHSDETTIALNIQLLAEITGWQIGALEAFTL